MDKGTLLTNGNSYSGDGGTLIVNGISYSGGVVESGGVDVSDTTAIENDVKQGKVFYLADGSKAAGTNTNNADTSADTVTEDKVKQGITFHKADGSSAVGTNTDVDVSDTTATMNDVLKGKNFYDKDGYLTEGLIETKDVPYWNTISDKMGNVIFGAGYYPDGAMVALDAISIMYLKPENIKKDIEILGVTGTLGGGSDVSDTTAIESDVLLGKIFHKANGSRAVGTLKTTKSARGTAITSASTSTTISCGFRPSYVAVSQGAASTGDANACRIYDASRSTTRQVSNGTADALPTTTANRIGSITDDGFTLTRTNNIGYVNWFAIE